MKRNKTINKIKQIRTWTIKWWIRMYCVLSRRTKCEMKNKSSKTKSNKKRKHKTQGEKNAYSTYATINANHLYDEHQTAFFFAIFSLHMRQSANKFTLFEEWTQNRTLKESEFQWGFFFSLKIISQSCVGKTRKGRLSSGV